METVNHLETLKLVLILFGTTSSLILGIIGVATETHVSIKETNETITIERRKRTKWFKFVIIGLIISSIITALSLLVDTRINKLNKELAEQEKIRSEQKLEEILKSTEESSHPLYPLKVEISITIKFTLEETKEFANYYNYFKKNMWTISTPENFDFFFISRGKLYYNYMPFLEPARNPPYDTILPKFHNAIIRTCAQAGLYLCTSDTVKFIDKTTADFALDIGNNVWNGRKFYIGNRSIPKTKYLIDFLTQTIQLGFTLEEPKNSSSKNLASLYSCKRGFLSVKLLSTVNRSMNLNQVLIYSGVNKDKYEVKFSENDIDKHRQINDEGYTFMKLYSKKIF